MSKRTRPGDPLLAVAYLRASTEEQELGRDGERADVQRWAAQHGVTIVAERVDQGVSGGDGISARPALQEALALVKSLGAGVLLVKDRTRLARDTFVAGAIERAAEGAGARVLSADGAGNGTSPTDRMVRSVLDAASELQRAQIKANTKAALASLRAQGRRNSRHAPYGFSHVEGRLEPDAGEQSTLARARELRASGMSIASIRQALEAEGFVTRNGRPFAVSSVHAMVTR